MPKKIKRYETKDAWSSKDAKYYYPVFDEHKDGEWVKTSDHLEAIQEENEACAKMADSYSTYPDLAEAIRLRSKS